MILADISAANETHWWQIVAGILAIPAAIVGLVFTFYSTKKLRLEIVKLERESAKSSGSRGKAVMSDAQFKEFILRNELKSLQDRQFGLLQWGIITLVASEIALSFIRQQAKQALIASGALTVNSPYPSSRYLQGTAFLFCLALIFTYFLRAISHSYGHYRSQLYAHAGILRTAPDRGWRGLLTVVLMIVPVFDLIARIYIRIQFQP